MFFGATPRDDDKFLANPVSEHQARRAPNDIPLSDELESILRLGKSNRELTDALLAGVENAPFGPERLRKCEGRRNDAVAVLAHLRQRLRSLGLPVEINNEMAELTPRSPDVCQGVRSRDEVVLAQLVGGCDALIKVVGSLEAHELLSRRACRHSNGTPRSSPRTSPEDMSSPRGSSEGTLPSPLSMPYIDIHLEASQLRAQAKQQLQSLSGSRKTESWWRAWFFDVVCEACTTRQEVLEHDAQVSDVLSSLYSRSCQAAKGDILCCAPLQDDLDGVRYRRLPDKDGCVLPKPVKRGKMVHVKGREGDWIFNRNGYLPLKHPVDGSALFLFSHKKSSVVDSEDSTGSDEQHATDSPTRPSKQKKQPGTPRNRAAKQQSALQGSSERSSPRSEGR